MSFLASLANLARRLKADRWPLVGRAVRRFGRGWNQWMHPEGVPACIDGQIPLHLSSQAFSGGYYGFDPKLTSEIRRLAAPGRAFLDAGAHVGIGSLLYAHWAGPQTRIAAFEPNPNVFPLLCENARLSGPSIQVLRSALGERVGETSFFVNGNDPNASLSAEAPGKYWYWENKPKPVLRECRAPMTTIDAFCAAFGFDPGVIKLDVEGAELPVLRGAAETLRRCRPCIILETHVFAWESFGYGAEDLKSFIVGKGYQIMDSDGRPFEGPLGAGPEKDNNHYLLRPL